MIRREDVEIHKRKTITPKHRATLFLEHDGRCYLCSEKIAGAWQVEHRIPIALGGLDEPGNWRPAHLDCHSKKTKADVTSIAKAKRLERKHDPDREKKPSRIQGRGFPPKGSGPKMKSRGFDKRPR